MGFPTFGPRRPIRGLRGKPGFVDISELNLAGLCLGNKIGYIALGLCEALGVALFFKL
jgi:hypothetical protein